MIKYFYALIVFALLPVHAIAQIPLETVAKQAIVIDTSTGQTLFSKNADERMPTSSMSKTLTAAIVFDALSKGDLKLTDTFKVSEKAWKKGGSKMFVALDSDVSVEDLLRGIIIQSGNDATIVVAEGIAGTEDAFAKRLNEMAQNYGMTNSHFTNASGWPDDNHYSTAHDLANMTINIIKDYPKYYSYFSETQFQYNDINQNNRNPLLYQNIGADGVKTGHTEAGGYGLIGSAKQDGRRIVMVLNGMDSSEERASESKKIMQWAFQSFDSKIIPVAAVSLSPIDIAYGESSSVKPILKDDIAVTVPKFLNAPITYQFEFKSPLIAPITMGDEIGTLTIVSPSGEAIKSQSVYAAETIKKSGFFKQTFQKMHRAMKGIVSQHG